MSARRLPTHPSTPGIPPPPLRPSGDIPSGNTPWDPAAGRQLSQPPASPPRRRALPSVGPRAAGAGRGQPAVSRGQPGALLPPPGADRAALGSSPCLSRRACAFFLPPQTELAVSGTGKPHHGGGGLCVCPLYKPRLRTDKTLQNVTAYNASTPPAFKRDYFLSCKMFIRCRVT